MIYNIIIFLALYFSLKCNFISGNAITHIINQDYDRAFKNLMENYESCKDNCKFIRLYNENMVISNEENFEKIKEKDILKEQGCDFGYYLPFGPIFYYFRKNEKEKLMELYDKKIIRETLGDFIYYSYFDTYENFKKKFEEKPNEFFGSYTAGYLMYKLGNIEKAKEIASVRYNHFKKQIEKDGWFYDGTKNTILEHYIYTLIFDVKLNEKEKEKLERAKKDFPYLFNFYNGE